VLSRSLFDAAGNDDMLFEFLQHMAAGSRCMQCRLCRPVSPAGFSRRPCRASRAQAVGSTHMIIGTRMRTALLLERKPVALCAAALLSSPPVLLAPLGSSR
jgi:hypothetical protein